MNAIRAPRRRPAPRRSPRRRSSRGFAMMTVVFVLVIMVGAAAALSTWGARNDHLSALSVRESRAAAAARAGLQWGAWHVRDPRGTLFAGAATMPSCFATKTFSSGAGSALPAPLDEFDVQVSCSRSPTSGAYQEDQRSVVVFTLTATAVAGAANGPERVERRAEMRIEACKDPAGVAPTWAC